LLHIYDEHGLDHLEDYDVVTSMVSGINYYTYIKSSAVTINDFNQIYSFVDEGNELITSGVFDEDSYDEIILAWENKNTSGGLVQLNKDGKIPSNLIPNANFISDFSLVNIIEFLDYYPNKINLTIGDKWYNSVDKLIFEATEINNGITYLPTENTIYYNNKDKSLYLWKSGEMILISETMTSIPITNVIEILD
jgi:hypothetical protein